MSNPIIFIRTRMVQALVTGGGGTSCGGGGGRV
jgi:hypothetical protein